MLKNYIKIAWRNILKSRLHSVVNVIGLSVGIAFTLLIAAYIWGELQVNRQLRNADDQYILQAKWKDPNMGYDLPLLEANLFLFETKAKAGAAIKNLHIPTALRISIFCGNLACQPRANILSLSKAK